jgi:AAA15 family ATPase/GTPase
MLKRLYIDNYKCLVNFEFATERSRLILGANGTGKSTVFESLATSPTHYRRKQSFSVIPSLILDMLGAEKRADIRVGG